MSDDTQRLRAADLTGTLPAFLRDAVVGREAPAELTEEDRETVEALVDLGVPEDEATKAVVEQRVPLVLAQQILGEAPRYTLEQLSRKAGVPEEFILEIRAASGLPVPELWGRNDLAWVRQLAKLLEIVPLSTLIRSTRARGTAVAAIVRSDLALVRDELILPMRRSGADDLTVSVALAEMSAAFDSLSIDALVRMYRAHLQHHLGSEMAALAARSDLDSVDIAIGFVDVVGYTALSAAIDPTGLDAVLEAFERRVVEVIAPLANVAAVKYLGDAVMLVAPDPIPLGEALVQLATPVPELEESPLRAGLAFGPTLIREGDYFGPAVNLAARLTDLARPWKVLADEELQARLESVFEAERIRPVRIRGIGVRRPLTVSRREDEAAA